MARKSQSQSQHPAVVAIIGNDSFLRSEALARVLEPWRSCMGDLGPVRFEGDKAEVAEVLDEVRTPSLLGDFRVALVDEADDFISEHREILEKYCVAPAEGSLLVLLCDSLPKNQRLYRAIDALGGILYCEVPKGPAFASWVTQRASTSYGKAIAPAAVQSLRRLLGDSAGWIDAELGKLAAYVGDRPEISATDVHELTDQRREEKVFGIVDAMHTGNAALALELWDQVQATDRAAIHRGLGGLALKVRQMIEAWDEFNASGNVFVIARRMFMDPSELRERLQRLGREELVAQQRDLLAADLASKTGLTDLPMAIERFIVTHTRRAAPGRREIRQDRQANVR